MDSAEAFAQLEAQGVLRPGEEGWWKVWGATWLHVRAGDLILSAGADGEMIATLVVERFEAKASPMRVGVVTDGGRRVTFGALSPLILLRWGTRNTLA